jgi:hypothetical protein
MLVYLEKAMWNVILVLVTVVTPFGLKKLNIGPKTSAFIAFALGYFLKLCGFTHWWILLFAVTQIIISFIEEYQKVSLTLTLSHSHAHSLSLSFFF